MTSQKSKSCVIIPARYKSSRFPGKPLAKIQNKPMIIWVAELSAKAVGKSHVYIATDDKRISEVVNKEGYQTIITSSNCLTGTDRIAEASKKLSYEIIVNVQGDEPLVDPNDIKKCISIKEENPKKVINGFSWINKNEDPENINIPKVVTNEKNELIYMSRKALPARKDILKEEPRYKKQVCIYAISPYELNLFYKYGKKSYLEKYEDIELLRFLELDIKIMMYECSKSSIAVDLPSDIKRVEDFLNKLNEK